MELCYCSNLHLFWELNSIRSVVPITADFLALSKGCLLTVFVFSYFH